MSVLSVVSPLLVFGRVVKTHSTRCRIGEATLASDVA